MGFSRQEYWSGLSLPSPVISPQQELLISFLLNMSNLIVKIDLPFVQDCYMVKLINVITIAS